MNKTNVHNVTVLGIIIIFGVVLFANSLRNGFHYDDEHIIVKNAHLRSLQNIPSFFMDATTLSGFVPPDEGGHYRPLVVTSYALNYSLGGLNPVGYHLVNLAFHIGSAFLVYLVVGAMLIREPGSPPPFPRRFPAAAAGLIFLVHPFNSEVVNYISARSSVMAAFFYLLAFWCWVKYREPVSPLARGLVEESAGSSRVHELTNPRTHVMYYVASLLAFLLAMLTKEIAITLPLVLWLYDFYFTGSRAQGLTRSRLFAWRAYLPYLPFLLFIAIPYFIIREISFGNSLPRFNGEMATHLSTQTVVLLEYLRMFLIPNGLSVVHDVTFYHSFFARPVLICMGIWILYLWIAVSVSKAYRVEWRMISFFMLFFLMAQLPTALIPLNAVLQENRGYLGMVGFAVVAGIILSRFSLGIEVYSKDAGNASRAPWVIFCVLLSLYAVLTFQRNTVWQDDLSLWTDTVRKAPRSPISHAGLGEAYEKRKRFLEAQEEFEKSLKINPRHFDALLGLGKVYGAMGKGEEAIARYLRALEMSPSNAVILNNVGALYDNLRMYDKAEVYLKKAIAVQPKHFIAQVNLGLVYERQGRLSEAASLYRKAMEINPAYPPARRHWNRVLNKMGDPKGRQERGEE